MCEKFVVMEINNEEKIDGGNLKASLDGCSLNLFCSLEEGVAVFHNWNEFLVPAANDDDFGGLLSANLILLRNQLLDNLLRLLFTTKEKCTVNAQ